METTAAEAEREERTKAAAESAREARRRKILERGTDRLALITGQTRSIPPSPPPDVPTIPPPAASKSSVAPPSDHEGDSLLRKSESEVQKYEIRDETDKPEFPNYNIGSEIPRDVLDIGVKLLPRHERGNIVATNSQHTNIDSGRSVSMPSQNSTSRSITATRHDATRKMHQIFTPNKIAACVASSENIRLLCAAAIASLVVLSYNGYNLGTRILTSAISFRPLWLVLLTDITIILGMLLGSKGLDKFVESRTVNEKVDLASKIGKALEAGLLLQKVLRAAFTDCGVCAAILIIGIPFNAPIRM